MSVAEIDRNNFFEADTNITAIHGPIANIFIIFQSCFLLHYQKYDIFYALPFFQKFEKSLIYKLKFLKLQQFQCFAMIFK